MAGRGLGLGWPMAISARSRSIAWHLNAVQFAQQTFDPSSARVGSWNCVWPQIEQDRSNVTFIMPIPWLRRDYH